MKQNKCFAKNVQNIHKCNDVIHFDQISNYHVNTQKYNYLSSELKILPVKDRYIMMTSK